MKSLPELSELKIVDLKSLPKPIKTGFEQLCLLAFMSFTKLTVQVTFTDSEAALYGCLDSLGLMQSSADLSVDTGTTVTHVQLPSFHNPGVPCCLSPVITITENSSFVLYMRLIQLIPSLPFFLDS